MAATNGTLGHFQTAARALPGIGVGTACKGTSLECTTFKIQRKVFLFVRAGEARLKLTASEDQAAMLAQTEPARYKVGSNGWVQLKFEDGDVIPRERIEHWVKESYFALAPDSSSSRPEKSSKRRK
jgi:hypothetical protein